MDKKDKAGKSWVSDVRKSGDKILFGKSRIQIKGLPRASSKELPQSVSKGIEDSSDSDQIVLNEPKEKNDTSFNKSELLRKNSSSASTEYESSVGRKDHEKKKRMFCKKKMIYLVPSDSTDKEEEDDTDISEASGSKHTDHGKRKRQQSGQNDTHSKLSATKKLKTVEENSTEDSSDSKVLSVIPMSRKNERKISSEDNTTEESSDSKMLSLTPVSKHQGSKRKKREISLNSSSDEEEGKNRGKKLKGKEIIKRPAIVTPKLTLDFSSSDEELPPLVTPKRRNSSGGSNASTSSTVPYFNSQVKEENAGLKSESTKDASESESDLDVPLGDIMKKRANDTVEMHNSDDDSDSQPLFPQVPKEEPSSHDKTAKYLSAYTQEEDCIFVCDSDEDDLLNSMSQQNVTLDFEDKREDSGDDEKQLAKFFLGDGSDTEDIKPDCPEKLLDFDWYNASTQKVESFKDDVDEEENYDLQTQVVPIKKEKKNRDIYDADTQIIICDNFDSDDDLFGAETQPPDIIHDTRSDDEEAYYNAPTQVVTPDMSELKKEGRRKSFDFDQDSDSDKKSKCKLDGKKKLGEYTQKRLGENVCKRLGENKKNKLGEVDKVDKKNKHSVTQNKNDGGCTIEHTKVETVKITKQFKSQKEAQKYLKKVKSNESLLDEATQPYEMSDNDSTQEYDWTDQQSVKSKIKHPLKGQSSSSDDDAYEIMTQVKPIKHVKKPVVEEFDPYSAQTQVDKAVIEISDDEADNELYSAATQVESIGRSTSKEDKVTKQRKLEKTAKEMGITNMGVPKNVIDAMSQMECKSEKVHDYYSEATQVIHGDMAESETEDDKYNAQTLAADDFSDNSEDNANLYNAETLAMHDQVESDGNEDLYGAATQVAHVNDAETESDAEMYAAATQVEKNIHKTKSKSQKYSAETLNMDEVEFDDNYNQMTQVDNDFHLSNSRKKKGKSLQSGQRKHDSDEDTNDPYMAQTQVISDPAENSENDEDKLYGLATQVEIPLDVSHETIESSDNDYVQMLDDDQEEQSLDLKSSKVDNQDNVDYVVMLDSSSDSGSPLPPKSSKDKKVVKTPQKDKKYEQLTMLKRISSAEKKTIEIPASMASKPKTLKEKRESFKLEKEKEKKDSFSVEKDKFYSKKKTKSDSKLTDINSDIKVVEDKQWLSKQKHREDKSSKTRRTSGPKQQDDDLEDPIKQAKNILAARGKQSGDQRPVKRKHTSLEGDVNVDDVKLPDEKTILEKGLPLLQYNQKNSQENSSSSKIQKVNSDKQSDRSHDKHHGYKDKHRSHSSSQSSERKSRDKSSKKSHDKSSGEKKAHDKSSNDRKSHDKSSSKKKSHDKSSSDKKSHDRSFSDKKSHDKSSPSKSHDKSNHHKKSSSKGSQSDKDRRKSSDSSKSSSSHSSKGSKTEKEKDLKKDKKDNSKDKTDKENTEQKATSVMNRIPKLSDSVHKETLSNTKSPLTSLDSQMSGGVMSLIGLKSVTSELGQTKNKPTEPVAQSVNSGAEGSSLTTSPIKNPPPSMYSERNLESTLEEKDPSLPKSILSKTLGKKKKLNVQFRLPAYSQAAENQARKKYKEENLQSYIKAHFPNGIPGLANNAHSLSGDTAQPSTSGLNQQAANYQNRPNLMQKLPLKQQAARSMPGTSGLQNSTNQYQDNRRPIPGRSVQTTTSIRVPVPDFKQGNSPTTEISIEDLDYFFLQVLTWNATWLEEYEKHLVTPPDIENAFQIKHLLNSYDSFDDYFVTLFPHLYLETWEKALRGWQETKGKKKIDIAYKRWDKPTEKMSLFTFTAVAPKDATYVLYEGDLCIVKMWGCTTKAGNPKFYPQFGFIEKIKYHFMENYNNSQKKAITISSKIALEPAEQNRIVILQGPPGTGKSHTIIGIIKKIYQLSKGSCCICLCAPSNSAVDELLKKLITERRKMEDEKKYSGFRLVRIGKPKNMHNDVYKYTYNEMLKSDLEEELKRKIREAVNTSVFQEIDTLTNRIASLQQQLDEKTVKMQTIEAGKLKSEISKWQKMKDDLEADIRHQNKSVRLTRDEEDKVRKNVLLKSHVICGTLNSFGNPGFMNILAPYVGSQIRRSCFNCIIVDEASQATELDTLIPLQYGTSKLILVGDPEQLPPTVLSQKSAQKSFGQSLFERFFSHFRYEEINPVLFLDTQYRMHPDIAYFPNKFTYKGELKTDQSVKDRCGQFQIKPYILFDMEEGQEVTTRRGAIINSTEAEFTIELCEFLMQRTKLNQKEIGIIAPYQQQKKIIKEGLDTRRLDKIEVNTVDSFQGREKEVIILSCTRAKNSSGGIGFLANNKRMNVALTRGKSALYVIGCLDSLKKGDVAWKTLIEDAAERKVIRKVNTAGDYNMVFNACLNVQARLGRQSVKDRCGQFQIKPYILFDMEEGQEVTTRRGAIINSTEAEFTIELCEILMQRTKLNQKEIGIIAPYQQQKKIIKEGLDTRRLDKIEVNTVDSFQGREKEVIILSCTRAKNSSGGIGFLANNKRMNVALTRGKSALYVIGCLDSLKKGDVAWKTLIEDAAERKVIRKVNTAGDYNMVFNACLNVQARLGRQFVT